MPAYTLWSYLLGYVIIKVKGSRGEDLINQAYSRGLYLWDIRKLRPGYFMAKMRADKFYLVRPIARRCGCKVEIHRKVGAPFLARYIWQRKMLLVGTIISCTIVYIFSLHIWFIQVEGVGGSKVSDVDQVLTDSGVLPGIAKKDLDLRGLEQTITTEVPGIAWVGSKVKGSLLTLQVVEKSFPQRDEDMGRDLVAEKAGRIERIIVFSGRALVSDGAVVDKGEVLIEGLTNDAGITIKPQGLIKGRVWYRGQGDIKLTEMYRYETGRRAFWYLLTFKEKAFKLGRKEPPFVEYNVVEENKKVSFFGMHLPVSLSRTIYNEVKSQTMRLTRDEAKRLALREAFEEIIPRLSREFELVDLQVDYIEGEGKPGNIIAKVYIETLEDIGVYVKSPEGEVIFAR